MGTFINTVNRVLRLNTIIGADDEDITSFTDTQHVATIQLAKAAVQSTLTELSADRILPYEEADGTITAEDGTRVYALPADFIRFRDENPFLLKLDSGGNSENTFITQYPGGEEAVRRQVLDYREQPGESRWFYQVMSSTKQIGLYQVPDASINNVVYRFPYEKSVYVTLATDTMPFTAQQELDAFADMAARRFQFTFTSQPIEGLERDSVYAVSKSNLMNLLRITNPSKSYGYSYQ